MASTQATGTPEKKPANGSAKKTEPPKITAVAYVIVLKSRENAKPREKKLLDRVIESERAKAIEMLEKLGG